MKLKPGVSIERLAMQAHYLMGAVEMAYRMVCDKDCVATSTTDSHKDRPKSLHNYGLAVDFRTRDLTQKEQKEIYALLLRKLDPLGFDTVLESDHFHVEYDPKEGEQLFGIATK